MIKYVATAAIVLAMAAFTAPASMAEGSGKCGKGEVWDADSKSCVKKKTGGGTGSGSVAR